MSESKVVKVKIGVVMRATFQQTVEMPKREYDRICKLMDSEEREERRQADDEIQGWIDFSDIHDMDDFECDNFQSIGE